MIRGKTTFKCDNCGNEFIGIDAELAATVFTAPVKCPKCGSIRTYPPGLFGLNKMFYKKIWGAMEKNNEME